MRFDPATFRSVLFAYTIITALQSLMWIVLSLMAILTFSCVLETPQYYKDDFVLTTIVKLYFQGDECIVLGYPPGYEDIDQVHLWKPVNIYPWMIVYLVLSTIQLFHSVYLFKNRNATGKFLKFLIKTSCFLMLLTILVDVVLTSYFVMDYVKLKDHYGDRIKIVDYDITVISIALFTVSARGFGLWLINVLEMLYLFAWATCNNDEEMEKMNDFERRTRQGVDNLNFRNSSDSLQIKPDRASYPATEFQPVRNLASYPLKQDRKISADSFEAVTPFNVEEIIPPVPPKKPVVIKPAPVHKNESCSCCTYLEDDGIGRWYHSHNCTTLKRELEEKLKTLRSTDATKVKRMTDFSHDIKNFKQGNGKGRTAYDVPQQGRNSQQMPVSLKSERTAF